MSEKISVIGGSGFVGTNLCKYLDSKQRDFEIIDLKMSKQFPSKFKFGDVRDQFSLRKAITGEIVVNLAAIHRDDIREKSNYWRTNVEVAENIAKICAEKNIKKIVFTSTVAVYGFAESGTDETGIINPFNEYGRTKFEAEERFRIWYKKGKNSLIIIRPTVLFGEGNRGNVFNLFNQIASRKFLMIGNGENKKSMAYIGNLVAFLELCIKSNKKYGLYNYVDTPDLTMNQLVEKVREKLLSKRGVGFRLPLFLGIMLGYIADLISFITQRNLLISSIRIKKFVLSTEFSSSKNDLENFCAPYKLTEGIERTLYSEFLSPNPEREIFYTE